MPCVRGRGSRAWRCLSAGASRQGFRRRTTRPTDDGSRSLSRVLLPVWLLVSTRAHVPARRGRFDAHERQGSQPGGIVSGPPLAASQSCRRDTGMRAGTSTSHLRKSWRAQTSDHTRSLTCALPAGALMRPGHDVQGAQSDRVLPPTKTHLSGTTVDHPGSRVDKDDRRRLSLAGASTPAAWKLRLSNADAALPNPGGRHLGSARGYSAQSRTRSATGAARQYDPCPP